MGEIFKDIIREVVKVIGSDDGIENFSRGRVVVGHGRQLWAKRRLVTYLKEARIYYSL